MNDATANLLIVEDEAHLRDGLVLNFEMDGFQVQAAPTLNEARLLLDDGHFDLILLDIMLPDGSGLDLCRELRQAGDFTPIIMLTAKNAPEDVVEGLERGADDYLSKPFNLEVLLSRVRVLLRRQRWIRSAPTAPKVVSRLGDAEVDWEAFEYRRHGKTHRLTGLEVRLLEAFVKNTGRILTREALLRDVWGLAGYKTRTVDNFVARLRRYFEEDPSNPKMFLTVRGSGYRFVLPPEDGLVATSPHSRTKMLKHPELTAKDIEAAKALTLRKLGQVSAQLEELLAGQDVTLVDIKLPHEPDPEWTQLVRLRQYKRLLNQALERMNTDDYGFCRVGAEPIPRLQLQEMPWADVCMAHAGQV